MVMVEEEVTMEAGEVITTVEGIIMEDTITTEDIIIMEEVPTMVDVITIKGGTTVTRIPSTSSAPEWGKDTMIRWCTVPATTMEPTGDSCDI